MLTIESFSDYWKLIAPREQQRAVVYQGFAEENDGDREIDRNGSCYYHIRRGVGGCIACIIVIDKIWCTGAGQHGLTDDDTVIGVHS